MKRDVATAVGTIGRRSVRVGGGSWCYACDIGTSKLVGPCRYLIQRTLNLRTRGLQCLIVGVGRNVDGVAGDINELGERKVDGHAAPGIERDETRRGDCRGYDWPAGQTG